MKRMIISLVAMLAMSTVAYGQTVDTSNTSNSSTNATQTASSMNAGVNAEVNQYGATHMRNESTVPVNVVGYGSFSQVSCTNSVGGGVSVPAVALVYNGPHADINCQHVVLGDAFGRAAQLAKSVGADDSARAALSMVFYAYCTSEIKGTNIAQACINMHLVAPNGDAKTGAVKVADLAPVQQLPVNAAQYLKPNTVSGQAAQAILQPTPGKAPVVAMANTEQSAQQLADQQALQGPRR